MKVRVEELPIGGCLLLHPHVAADDRGRFVKVFHASTFRDLGLEADFVESFVSTSIAGVIRGLHYQAPPHDHAKLVYCTAGSVLDVALDLRAGSPTFGEYCSATLDAESGTMIYLPRGIAHGFRVTSESATLTYMTTSEHAPEHDRGIRWDTPGIDWGIEAAPILSPRDAEHPGWDEYAASPLF